MPKNGDTLWGKKRSLHGAFQFSDTQSPQWYIGKDKNYLYNVDTIWKKFSELGWSHILCLQNAFLHTQKWRATKCFWAGNGLIFKNINIVAESRSDWNMGSIKAGRPVRRMLPCNRQGVCWGRPELKNVEDSRNARSITKAVGDTWQLTGYRIQEREKAKGNCKIPSLSEEHFLVLFSVFKQNK